MLYEDIDMNRSLLLFGVLVGTVLSAYADVSLPSMFSDGMVLQRDQENYVWGWAEPGETITVEFDGVVESASTAKNGTWFVQLPPFGLGDAKTMSVGGKNTITIQDILMGDVWVCSGQSNMQWSVRQSKDAVAEMANADYPAIRLFNVPLTVALTEQADIEAKWVHTTPETVGGFSAVGYFFGRELHLDLDVPIGLIATSWGGTTIESWISQGAAKNSETFDWLNKDWMPDVESQGEAMLNYYDRSISPRPEAPKTKRNLRNNPLVPSFNYNAMIAPLWQFGIKGSIWYQGESNASRAYQYRDLMKTMIVDWRDQFDQGEFPFFIVQLANYRVREAEPGPSDWAELREAQSMAMELPYVGMATIIDIGEAQDIHPRNKQGVGYRLGQSALKIAYGKDVVGSGPVYERHVMRKGRVVLHFSSLGGGLMTPGGEELTGVSIAGEDEKFYWADAKIKGTRIVVGSDNVPNPVAVRYGWANNPDCNLYNEAGLPASPFRTDDWAMTTLNAR